MSLMPAIEPMDPLELPARGGSRQTYEPLKGLGMTKTVVIVFGLSVRLTAYFHWSTTFVYHDICAQCLQFRNVNNNQIKIDTAVATGSKTL